MEYKRIKYLFVFPWECYLLANSTEVKVKTCMWDIDWEIFGSIRLILVVVPQIKKIAWNTFWNAFRNVKILRKHKFMLLFVMIFKFFTDTVIREMQWLIAAFDFSLLFDLHFISPYVFEIISSHDYFYEFSFYDYSIVTSFFHKISCANRWYSSC